MLLPTGLIKGTLLKRYKRFLCDVKLESGEIITAHCPNSGSMLTVNIPLATVYLSKIDNPKAKLSHRLELIEINNALIGINTMNANRIVYEALQKQMIPELQHFNAIKKEAVFTSNCRFDFMLHHEASSITPKAYLEVKSVTLMREKALAEFPDAVTTRGQKHAEKLITAIKTGAEAYILYLVQREDCNTFSLAQDIDPLYYKAVKLAILNGVKILCYTCSVTMQEIKLSKALKFVL